MKMDQQCCSSNNNNNSGSIRKVQRIVIHEDDAVIDNIRSSPSSSSSPVRNVVVSTIDCDLNQLSSHSSSNHSFDPATATDDADAAVGATTTATAVKTFDPRKIYRRGSSILRVRTVDESLRNHYGMNNDGDGRSSSLSSLDHSGSNKKRQRRPMDEADRRNSNTAGSGSTTRTIRFDTIEIREYPRTVGDNPSCSSGPPITIGWKYNIMEKMDIADYEKNRPPRRQNHEMLLPRKVRYDLLVRDWKVKQRDIARCIRSTIRVKNYRKMTVNNLDAGTTNFELTLEKIGKTIKRLLLCQKSVHRQVQEMLLAADAADRYQKQELVRAHVLMIKQQEKEAAAAAASASAASTNANNAKSAGGAATPSSGTLDGSTSRKSKRSPSLDNSDSTASMTEIPLDASTSSRTGVVPVAATTTTSGRGRGGYSNSPVKKSSMKVTSTIPRIPTR